MGAASFTTLRGFVSEKENGGISLQHALTFIRFSCERDDPHFKGLHFVTAVRLLTVLLSLF
jgi:hypothetical protein